MHENAGPSLLQMLEQDVIKQWRLYDTAPNIEINGRIDGLVKAVATIRVPYDRDNEQTLRRIKRELRDLSRSSSARKPKVRRTEIGDVRRPRRVPKV